MTSAEPTRGRAFFVIALAASGLACGSPDPHARPATPSVAAPPAAIVEARRVAVGMGWTCAISGALRVVCRGVLPVQAIALERSVWMARGPEELPEGYDMGARAVPELDGSVEIVSTRATLCARDTESRVRCWGELLGRSSLARSRPSEVVALRGASSLALSSTMLCGLFGGHVRCWVTRAPGEDDAATVGPAVALAIDDATAIEGADAAVCVARRNHPVTCVLGELDAREEASIEGTKGAEHVTVAGSGPCFVRDGAVRCTGVRGAPAPEVTATPRGTAVRGALDWVLDRSGELSVAREEARPLRLEHVTAVAVYEHGCARSGGRLMCWGANSLGQLAERATPEETVSRIEGVPAVSLVAARTPQRGSRSIPGACALDGEGRAWCWDGARVMPTAVPSGSALRSLVAPGCGVADDGSVQCVCSGAMRTIAGLDASGALAGGDDAILAADRDGEVRLVTAPCDPDPSITDLAALRGATELALGGCFACGLVGGRTRCAGQDPTTFPCSAWTRGALPYEADATFDPPISSARGLVAGANHVCARRGGRFVCWGRQGLQRDAQGRVSRAEPTTVLDAHVTGLVIGWDRTCAWGAEGTLRCANTAPLVAGRWLGSWEEIPQIRGVRAVSLGAPSCAVGASGELWCWGAGPRGNGTTPYAPEPMEVDLEAPR